MKKTIITLTLAALAAACSPVHAVADVQKCEIEHEIAYRVMLERQQETPITLVLDKARAMDDKMVGALMAIHAVGAYREPSYNHEEIQDRVARRYANDAYMECITKG